MGNLPSCSRPNVVESADPGLNVVVQLHDTVQHTIRSITTGPTFWLTSTGFVTDTQWVNFIQVVLARRGVLKPEDTGLEAKREDIVAKYADEIAKLKVTYINDASYHRPTSMMSAGRMENEQGDSIATMKVGEGLPDIKGRGEGSWFFWDQGLEDCMGIPRQNIAMIQLLEKPWLFNRPGRLANFDPQNPNVPNLDPADQEAYYAALQHTQDAYDALKQDVPQVGAGQAGGTLPGCPASGLSCANHLAEISTKLNSKYQDAVDKWCEQHIDKADVVVGQGGEVVMLNMAWQCNQIIAERLVDAVRSNKCVYAGLSAATMVAAKSMEMTGEIQPGWIEAFACDSKHLTRKHFDANDLDNDGTATKHLGALPLVKAPLAIRPHYSKDWEDEVLEKNLIAEKEFETETGTKADEKLVQKSVCGTKQGCRLLSLIASEAKCQDNPVFVPIKNGIVIEIHVSRTTCDGRKVKEYFHCID